MGPVPPFRRSGRHSQATLTYKRSGDERLDPIVTLGLGGIAYYIAYSQLGVPPYEWYYCPVIIALSITVAFLGPPALMRSVRRPSSGRRLTAAGQVLLGVVALTQAIVVLGHDLPSWREPVLVGNVAPATDYERAAAQLSRRIGNRTVASTGEIGALAYFCECPIVDLFSDRGLLRPQVALKLAEAGPITRFLLKLNFLRLDRDVLPRRAEYTLLWAHGRGTGSNSWGNLSSSVVGTRHLVLVRNPRIESKTVHSLSREVLASLPSGSRPVFLKASQAVDRGYEMAVAVELERRGAHARLDRVFPGEPVKATLTIASGSEIDRLLTRPAARLVAYGGSVSWNRRGEIKRQARELDTMHRAGTLTDFESYVRAAALPKLVNDVAIISQG